MTHCSSGLGYTVAPFPNALPMSASIVGELIDLLQLERLEDNLFRGQSRDIGTRYVFGGQVLGQALSAAQQTVDASRTAHSLHAYFLRAGDVEAPIIYSVERSRDGGSFSARRIVAIQHGQPIFNMTASFQTPEPGAEHQFPMPLVPKPEDLPQVDIVPANELDKIPAKRKRWLNKAGPFEFRHVHPRNELNPTKQPPYQNVWFRLVDRVPDNPVLHRSLLAYASDFHLIGTTTFPHAHFLPAAERAHGQPRSRHVVPPPIPRRRMAAVLLRQPERAALAWPGTRHDLQPRWHPRRLDGAGRLDPRGRRHQVSRRRRFRAAA